MTTHDHVRAIVQTLTAPFTAEEVRAKIHEVSPTATRMAISMALSRMTRRGELQVVSEHRGRAPTTYCRHASPRREAIKTLIRGRQYVRIETDGRIRVKAGHTDLYNAVKLLLDESL